jgi:hypothetical protein
MQTGPGSGIDGSGPGARNVNVRRLWLPWRPRMRLILLYPRCWHYVCVWLERFDLWLSGRYTGAARRIAVSLALLPFVAVRFIGLVAVLEITIITFTISIYLVWGEWMLLLLLFPFTLLARLVGALRAWANSAGPRRSAVGRRAAKPWPTRPLPCRQVRQLGHRSCGRPGSGCSRHGAEKSTARRDGLKREDTIAAVRELAALGASGVHGIAVARMTSIRA